MFVTVYVPKTAPTYMLPLFEALGSVRMITSRSLLFSTTQHIALIAILLVTVASIDVLQDQEPKELSEVPVEGYLVAGFEAHYYVSCSDNLPTLPEWMKDEYYRDGDEYYFSVRFEDRVEEIYSGVDWNSSALVERYVSGRAVVVNEPNFAFGASGTLPREIVFKSVEKIGPSMTECEPLASLAMFPELIEH